MKDLLDMTRRERRGMIVLLIAVFLMLTIAALVRWHKPVVPISTDQVEISAFESETDSITVDESKPLRHEPKREPTRKRPHRAPAKPKPAKEPRPVDPVPRF